MSKYKIVTIGLSPAWDLTVEIRDVIIRKIAPAGKALNINKALAQMGQGSIAAGLWGQDDWSRMKKATAYLKKFVQIRFLKVKGKTRKNITVIKRKGLIHLRSKSGLADEKSISALNKNLQRIVTNRSICIFAGAMPDGKLLNKAVRLVHTAKRKGAKTVIDTSGMALKKIVKEGELFIIKPNIEELGEIAGGKIPDRKSAIITAAGRLLKKSEIVLVSRGRKGAILISEDGIISCRYTGRRYDFFNTVGCGDFLLAGFIKELCRTGDLKESLKNGIIAATAKAFALNGKTALQQISRKIEFA